MNDQRIGLSFSEIQEITGKLLPHAQAKQLDKMHIPYLKRTNGTLFVARAAAYDAMGLKQKIEKTAREIDLSGLEAWQNGQKKKTRQTFTAINVC